MATCNPQPDNCIRWQSSNGRVTFSHQNEIHVRLISCYSRCVPLLPAIVLTDKSVHAHCAFAHCINAMSGTPDIHQIRCVSVWSAVICGCSVEFVFGFFFGFQHVFFWLRYALTFYARPNLKHHSRLNWQQHQHSTGKKNNTFLNGSVDYEIIEMSKVYKNSIWKVRNWTHWASPPLTKSTHTLSAIIIVEWWSSENFSQQQRSMNMKFINSVQMKTALNGSNSSSWFNFWITRFRFWQMTQSPIEENWTKLFGIRVRMTFILNFAYTRHSRVTTTTTMHSWEQLNHVMGFEKWITRINLQLGEIC